MQLNAVGALQAAHTDHHRFAGELVRLQVGHPKEVPAARAVLDGGDAHRIGAIRERGLVERQSPATRTNLGCKLHVVSCRFARAVGSLANFNL